MASASSDSVPVDDIKYLLTCSMCSETLNEPRSLPCLHNFCKVCLGKYIYLFQCICLLACIFVQNLLHIYTTFMKLSCMVLANWCTSVTKKPTMTGHHPVPSIESSILYFMVKYLVLIRISFVIDFLNQM